MFDELVRKSNAIQAIDTSDIVKKDDCNYLLRLWNST